MSIRGKAAIVGIGEVPTRRAYPGRTVWGLAAEAARLAIEDSGLKKRDIDGLITEGGSIAPAEMAEYLGMQPNFSTGTSMMGATAATSVTVAAMAVASGLANYVLVVLASPRDPTVTPEFAPQRNVTSEWESPFGPAVAANNAYGWLYQRHMYEFGTKPEQMAQMAVNQRFNAQKNPNAAFAGQEITVEDVMNSRYINEPLHILESVMPCGGAAACIVTSYERAKGLPNRPAVILGSGIGQRYLHTWLNDRVTTTPVQISAPRAFAMAGYSPKDMQFAEFYDCYTILEAACLEDAGFCKKGEIGPFFESTDTTYKGTFPINTDGGQLSGGQPGLAGGFRHVIEGARQIMGKAGERQVAKNDLCMVNG